MALMVDSMRGARSEWLSNEGAGIGELPDARSQPPCCANLRSKDCAQAVRQASGTRTQASRMQAQRVPPPPPPRMRGTRTARTDFRLLPLCESARGFFLELVYLGASEGSAGTASVLTSGGNRRGLSGILAILAILRGPSH